jgi:hypothetical protein
MGWFGRKPTQQKYIEAAVTVASNLYLQTIPGADDAPADLQFHLHDSRYRYLLFCLSAVVTAALAYDERKQIQPHALLQGCSLFVTWAATESAQQFFDDPAQAAGSDGKTIFQQFLKQWSGWPDLEKEGRNAEIIDLICSMIHTTESNDPIDQADAHRLGELALQIDCRLPTMRGALVELVNR